MRAVVFEAFGGPLAVREVARPPCPPEGVVIRVEATGVCRSDWHGWQGHDDGVVLPHVPGHELAGTVVDVGHAVRSWREGDVVTVPFVCACGECPACAAGEHQVCERQTQPGFTHWGSFADLVAVEHADVNLVRLPPAMTAVTAASLGCRFATAYRALRVHGRARPGDWVAVHGCGGVGLSAVMIAVAAGARVVAVDVSEPAREAARSLGAEAVLDPSLPSESEVVRDPGRPSRSEVVRDLGRPSRSEVVRDLGRPSRSEVVRGSHLRLPEDVAALVVDATDGGAHVSIDALGRPDTAIASVLSLRRRGRHIQVGLLLAGDARPTLPMDRVVAWELEIYGSHGMAAHEYPAMLDEVASGRLRPELLVGRTVGLEDAPRALEEMGSPGGGRAAGMTVVVP